MSLPHLEALTAEFLTIIASKRVKAKEERIQELNQLINSSILSNSKLKRYHELVPKLENRTMSDEEKNEFGILTAEDELMRSQRLKYMIELAKLREIPFLEIKKEFSFKAEEYV